MDYIQPNFRIEMNLVQGSLFIYLDGLNKRLTINEIIEMAKKSPNNAKNAIDIIESIRRQIINQSPSLTIQLNNMSGVEERPSVSDWTFHLTEQWVTLPLRSIYPMVYSTTPPSTARRDNDQNQEALAI